MYLQNSTKLQKLEDWRENQTRESSLQLCQNQSSVAHHNCHINSIFVYLYMPELFIDKICFCKFLSMSDKPRLNQLKFISSSPSSTVKAYLTYHPYGKIPSRKGKYPMLRIQSLTNLSSPLKFLIP